MLKILSSVDIDMLKEVGTIGAGHAATSLSAMLNKRVVIKVPDIRLLQLAEVADYLGGADQLATIIHMAIYGEVNGAVLIILSQESAIRLVDILLNGDHVPADAFDEYEQSALAELGNITGGAYIVALSQLTGHRIMCSTPSLVIDMLGSILNETLSQVAEEADEVLLLDTEFILEQEKISGSFLIIPDGLIHISDV